MISERRKKILAIICKKGPSTYKEILDAVSDSDSSSGFDPIEILSDIDTLVFFRFLQHVNQKKSKITPETVLELRPKTKDQIKNDPSRIDVRLRKIEHEIPPWYRKRAILTLLEIPLDDKEIKTRVAEQYPDARWPPFLVDASLRILKKSKYKGIEKEKEQYITVTSKKYQLASGGKTLLESHPFHQFSTLRTLKDEFTNEFRAHVILNLVKEHNASGISSGKIARYLQREYGIRGNKRKAIRNTLENMVFAGLVKVLGSSDQKEGHVYQLGPTVRSTPLPLKKEGNTMSNHNIQDFKETVTKFLGEYPVFTTDVDKISSINQVLTDFEQCKQDMLIRSPEEWIDAIVMLSDYLRSTTGNTWEKRAFRCIAACLLSRLLPSEIAVNVLETCPPPVSKSEEQYHYYSGIAREYYFDLTEVYLDLKMDEKAYRSCEDLEKLGWEFFEFLILKGRIKMRKGEFQKALKTFEKAEKKAEKREKIVALFYKGLAHFQRGNFKETEKAWVQCLNKGCTFEQKVVVSHNLANLYRLMGKLNEARTLYENIVAAAQFSAMEEFRAESLLGLATVLIDSGLWEKAEETLNNVKECAEGTTVVKALAETNLGVISCRKGELEKALEYHKTALTMVDKDTHPQVYSTILINVGDTYRQVTETDKALNTFKEALKIIHAENKALLQALQISLAELYVDMGDLTKGWELAHSVLLERWLDDHRSEGEAYRIQGKILLRQHQGEKAKEQLMKSESIFTELNLHYELISVFKLLEECYSVLQNEEKVNYYQNQRKRLTREAGVR